LPKKSHHGESSNLIDEEPCRLLDQSYLPFLRLM